MSPSPSQPGRRALPVRGSLRPYALLSILIAVVMAAASAAGLIVTDRVYPTDALVGAFLLNDVVNLAVGLPVLLVSLWLTRRGSLVGLLLWPGALFFVLYTYLIYLLAMPPNPAFLAHLVLVAASAYTMASLLATIDTRQVASRLGGGAPARLGGGVLVALGLIFSFRAVGMVVAGWRAGVGLPETELALLIADFLIAPAWVAGGIMLWRRTGLGLTAGLGLLFQGSMLFVGLIAVMLLQPLATGTAYPAGDILAVLLMGTVCFVPFGLTVRAAREPAIG